MLKSAFASSPSRPAKGGLLPYCLAVLTLAGCTRPERYRLHSSHEESFRTMVHQYQSEASRLGQADRTFGVSAGRSPQAEIALPPDLSPPGARVQADLPAHETTLDKLYLSAITHSSQIKVFSDLPLIRETAIQEARGAFDVRAFVEGRYDSVNDPVGSTLTTGGPSRLEEDKLKFRAGLRKKVETGAELYATQELGRTESNSVFFLPNPQTQARLVVGALQPLLNGAGVGYNRSIVQIARIDSEIAQKEFVRQIEAHLLEITRTYWGLYLARGVYQAKSHAAEQAAKILSDLESRGNFDALRQQILRGRAVAAERRADLIRAESAVRNAEDRLKALVNDPAMRDVSALEIIPTDLPVLKHASDDLQTAASYALENRPEIQQAFLQLKASAVRRDMSRNELMPVLNLIVEGYLADIQQNNWGRAYEGQFEQDEPGYSIGLRFEFPLGNNEAEARNLRRRLEMRQLISQLRTTMETVLLEVKVAVREVNTAYRDMLAKQESMRAAREDVSDFQRRREAMFLGADTSAIGYMEFLVDAQQRQVIAEENFLTSVATYNVALVSLQKAKGSLLAYEAIKPERIEIKDGDELRSRGEDRELPELRLKQEAPAQADAPTP